jgi:uncharacterized SAM-binding protein YcdF (DUF218 family)
MLPLSFQKFLALSVMPVGLLWFGLIVVMFWALWRRHFVTALLLLVLAGMYAIAGNVLVGGVLMASLESQVPRVDPVDVEPFDAVCVLGGGTELDGEGHPQLGTSGDRVMMAARLYHAGKAKLLVASGVSLDDSAQPRDLAQETRSLWLAMGVPDTAILCITDPCRITREEIAAYAALQRQRAWKRVAVISSAWHLPRAMALAEHAGLTMIPVGSDWRGRDRSWRVQDCVPQGQGFLHVQLACWEYLGRWVGR